VPLSATLLLPVHMITLLIAFAAVFSVSAVISVACIICAPVVGEHEDDRQEMNELPLAL
jgi:hypothetical protein